MKHLQFFTFILGVFAVFGIMYFFGLETIISTLMTTNLFIVWLAFLVHILILLLLCLRLMIISEKYYKNKMSVKKAFRIVITGLFVNFLTPIAKIGGEPVKIYMIKKDVGASKAASIISLDTLVEVLSALIFFIVIVISFISSIPKNFLPYYIFFSTLTLAIIVIFLKISLTYKWLGKLTDFAFKNLSKFKKIEKKDYAKEFQKSFKSILKDGKVLTRTFSITLLTKFLEVLRMWLVFAALNVFIPLPTIMLVWAFILILAFVPWLPGGLGLIEGGTAYAYITFGILKSIALTGVILERFISYWFTIILGMLLASKNLGKMIKKF